MTPITPYVADWLYRADEDRRAARVLLNEGGLMNSVCSHCHQAAEKYLKASLAYYGKNVRKVHDVAALLQRCSEIDQAFIALDESVAELSEYYIETRYPGNAPAYTAQDAQRALAAADRVGEFVHQALEDKEESQP